MTYLDRTQKLWDLYLELCREYDSLKLDDHQGARLRKDLCVKKIEVLKEIRNGQ